MFVQQTASRRRLTGRIIAGGLLLAFLLTSCSLKPAATGENNELGILIDPEVQILAEAALLKTFCPIVETPQPERRFEPLFGGMDRINTLQTQKFLLIVGVLDGEGEISALIGKMLSPKIAEGVKKGDYFVFVKRNEWARGQLMMILVAPNLNSLVERLGSEPEELFPVFNRQRCEEIQRELYGRYEQKDLAADIRERYGFDLRIPHDWVLVREEPEAGWLRLRRSAPDRFITLWRSAPLDEDPIDSTWVMEIWSQLGSLYPDPIRANAEFLRLENYQMDGISGLEIHGLWETIGPLGGGPFVCRAFYDPAEQRAYLLEGEVFNPGGEKEPYLKQIEVILGTIKMERAFSQY